MAKFFQNNSIKLDKVQLILGAIFSLLFSASIVLGRMISYHNNMYGFLDENFIREGKIIDLFIFIIVSIIVFFIVTLMMQNWSFLSSLFVTSNERIRPLRFGIIAGIIIVVCWLPYILALAPGSVLEDSYYSINQMLMYGHPTSNDHPIFYTLFVGACCRLGIMIKDINLGVLIYSIIQSILMIFTIVYGLVIMYEHKVATWVLAICIAYFSLLPIFPFYAMIMWKDPLFSCALLWMSMLIFRKMLGDDIRNWWIKYFLACLFCVLLRNNGLYVCAAMMIIPFICVKKDRFKLSFIATIAVVFLFGVRFIAGYMWNTTNGKYVENLGVMLQQIAYCVSVGDELDHEDMLFINEIMPIEDMKATYMPCLVDSIKWNTEFHDEIIEANKDKFFDVWLSFVRKYPKDCIRAYLLNTQGFWRIDAQNSYGYAEGYIYESNYDISYYDIKILPKHVIELLRNFMIYIPTGIWFFAVFLGMILSQKLKYIMGYMPALLCWASVMVAAPVAFSNRYVWILTLGFPLYVVMSIIVGQIRGEDEILND